MSAQLLDLPNELCLIVCQVNVGGMDVNVHTSDISFTDSIVWNMQKLKPQ